MTPNPATLIDPALIARLNEFLHHEIALRASWAEAADRDAAFDGGEFSGPASERAAERDIEALAQRLGFSSADAVRAAIEALDLVCVREHGADGLPPPEVFALLASGALEDWSWHNDICASFALKGTDSDDNARDYRLWVFAEDPSRREVEDAPRFQVSNGQGDIECETESISEALDALRRVVQGGKERQI